MKIDKKIKYTISLHKHFINYKEPKLIISFICLNIYELINEIKYLPDSDTYSHSDPSGFSHEFFLSYWQYHHKMIATNNHTWVSSLFPFPVFGTYFSFKKFYIGLVGRVYFCSQSNYTYGDPLNWTIGYDFYLDDENQLAMSIGQYILLDNYSTFQVNEESGNEQISRFAFVIFKSINKYECQAYVENELDMVSKQYTNEENNINKLMLDGESEFNQTYDPRIGEVCKKICESRKTYITGTGNQPSEILNQPLFTYKEELERNIVPILKNEDMSTIVQEVATPGLKKKKKLEKKYNQKLVSIWYKICAKFSSTKIR